ncbi:diguanylate cyclase, partial [Aeromonas hydrophila]
FVAVGMGPQCGEETREAAVQGFQRRLFEASLVQLEVPAGLLHYPGASVGVVGIDPASSTVDEALRLADACMYEVKRQRRRPS